jgi:hypothetical protein
MKRGKLTTLTYHRSLASLVALLFAISWCCAISGLSDQRNKRFDDTQVRNSSGYDKESYIVIAEVLRFSIQSMQWKGQELEVTCFSQLIPTDGTWGFDR